jgi:hypothetical protein
MTGRMCIPMVSDLLLDENEFFLLCSHCASTVYLLVAQWELGLRTVPYRFTAV